MTTSRIAFLVAFGVAAVIVTIARDRWSRFLTRALVRHGGMGTILWALALAAALLLAGIRPPRWPWFIALAALGVGVSQLIGARRSWKVKRRERFSAQRLQKARRMAGVGTGGNLFGPNQLDVERFLAGVQALSVEQWRTVLSRAELREGRLIPGAWHMWNIRRALRHLDQTGRDAERMAASGELAKLSAFTDNDDNNLEAHLRHVAAAEAVEALVVRDLLAPEDLVHLYRPFELVIPLATLPVRQPEIRRLDEG